MRNFLSFVGLWLVAGGSLNAQTHYAGEYRFKKDKNNTCTIVLAQSGTEISYRIQAVRDGEPRSFSGQTVVSKKGVAKAYLSDRQRGAHARLVFTKRSLKVKFRRALIGHYKWLRFNGLYKKSTRDTPEDNPKEPSK